MVELPTKKGAKTETIKFSDYIKGLDNVTLATFKIAITVTVEVNPGNRYDTASNNG